MALHIFSGTKNIYCFRNCCPSTLKGTNNRTHFVTEILKNVERHGGKYIMYNIPTAIPV